MLKDTSTDGYIMVDLCRHIDADDKVPLNDRVRPQVDQNEYQWTQKMQHFHGHGITMEFWCVCVEVTALTAKSLQKIKWEDKEMDLVELVQSHQ